jgi:endonuclease G, mitochondrial
MPKRKKSQSSSGKSSRRRPRKKNQLLALLTLVLLGFACVRFISSPSASVEGNANLLLGNPTGAVANSANTTNYLIARPQYVLSYNRDKGIANWASWQLNQSWLGTLPRGDFAPDTTLPPGWYTVQPDDYTRSGFDRGHLVPAADRDRIEADSNAVFLMTNVVPQAPDNNRGPWEKLESYCRDLVEQGKELYIIAGGAGSGGVGERGKRTTIGYGNVAVPAAMWKVVVVFDRPGLELADITPSTRVIAVIIPNRQGIKDDNWQQFRTTVDNVEALTGYNFLTKISEATQNVLEANVDNQ